VHRSKPVADYLAAVSRELDFDPALARRVRDEVEDHLWQAVEDRGGPSIENQLRAIENFGEARELARGYVAASLLSQVRYIGAGALITAASVSLAMKVRVAWYVWMHWELGADFASVTAVALLIDRYATKLAIAAALIACAYIATRRVPARIDRSYRKQLIRSLVLCGASAGALSLCVATEVILTGVQLSARQWGVTATVPLLSLAVEIVAMIGFVSAIYISIRRGALAAALLRD
jgi:hypothetical protein